MRMIAHLIFAVSFLGSVALQASAQETLRCAVPSKPQSPIFSTHGMVPYPTISQRLNEHGTTRLTIAIGTDGVPTDVMVTQSSGSQRLDDAAVAYIKAHWRWEPALEDCKPASAQAPIIIDWHLGLPPKADLAMKMPEADYPDGAAERGEVGNTYLKLSLGDGGIVKDGQIVYSSGYSDLDDKALAVMKASPDVMAGKSAGTQIVILRWILPSQPSEHPEILEIYGSRIPFY